MNSTRYTAFSRPYMSSCNATLNVNIKTPNGGRHGLRRLPAQEGGDLELVLLGRIMHRSLSSKRVKPLMAMPFVTVFGGWIRRRTRITLASGTRPG